MNPRLGGQRPAFIGAFKRLGHRAVVVLDERQYFRDQVGHRRKAATSQQLAADDAEPDLNEADAIFSNLLSSLLWKEGLEVLFAGGGIRGPEAVRKHCPDLVVLDVPMARVDGWQSQQDGGTGGSQCSSD